MLNNKILLASAVGGAKTFTCQYDSAQPSPSGWTTVIRVNGNDVPLSGETVIDVSVGDALELYTYGAPGLWHPDRINGWIYVTSKKGISISDGLMPGSYVDGYTVPVTIESVPASLVFWIS